MKTYKLVGKNHNRDICFTVEDLIPVKHTKSYGYTKLVKLIDYTNYENPKERFDEDYVTLYKKPGNRNIDFFKIRGTNIIVIPGNYVYPTTLTLKDIN